jgi:hypothetical protein
MQIYEFFQRGHIISAILDRGEPISAACFVTLAVSSCLIQEMWGSERNSDRIHERFPTDARHARWALLLEQLWFSRWRLGAIGAINRL